MSPSKQKRGHRSATDPLSQAIPIIPIHRDSITYPLPLGGIQRLPPRSLAMSDVESSSGPKSKARHSSTPNTLPLPPLREAAPSVKGLPEDHYNKWMSSYVSNPFDDVDNTCLGLWATCALYGKTHWRLQQIVAGESPQDDAWRSKNGFNSACWAQWGSSFFFVDPLGGVLVGIQRSQIRGTYGIDGNLAQDMILGVCMPKATQMHNDREVRAREGKIELRNSKEYKTFRESSRKVTINQQPRPQPQMTFAPGGPTHLRSRVEKLTDKRNIHGGLTSETNNKSHTKGRKEQPVNENLLQPTRSFRIIRNKQPNGFKASRSNVAEGGYDGANPIMLATYAQDDHFPEAARVKAKRPMSRQRFHHGYHLSGVPEERNAVIQIVNPSEVTVRKSSQSRLGIDRPLPPLPSNRHGRGSFQFPLPDCDTIIGTAEGIMVRHSPTKGQKDLSYIHDFTDSPNGKDVLDHYEQDETKSQAKPRHDPKSDPRTASDQHSLEECTPTISGTATSQHNINNYTSEQSSPRISQHALSSCSSMVPSPATTTPQHTLQDCTSLVSLPRMTRQHSLNDCTPVVSSPDTITSQHDLDSCVSTGSIPRTSTPQHNLSDCSQTSSVAGTPQRSPEDSEQLIHPKHDPISRHSADEQVTIMASGAKQENAQKGKVREHTLENCETGLTFRKASLAQHKLGDCESDLASRKVSLISHTLEDCDADLFSRKTSLDQHTLGDCDADISSRTPSLPQHTLRGCETDLVPTNPSLLQHTLDEDSPVSSGKTAVEHAIQDDVTSVVSKKSSEHTLDNCSVRARSPSTSADEHPLSDCSPRSSLETTGDPQHVLDDCSPVTSSQLDEPTEHSLAYCSPQPMSESGSVSSRRSSIGSSASHGAGRSNQKQQLGAREHRRASCPTPPASPRQINGANGPKIPNESQAVPKQHADQESKRADEKTGVIEHHSHHHQKHQHKSRNGQKALASRTDAVEKGRKEKEDRKQEKENATQKRGMSPNPSESSATPSMAQHFLAQILAQNQSKKKSQQLDGADDFESVEF